MYMTVKGKGGKHKLKSLDEYRGHVDNDGKCEHEYTTTKKSRIKQRNVSLQHFDDNWDKIFKK